MDGWDEALREAHAEGEALVIRGTLYDITFEIDVIELRKDVLDPFRDACERAFEGEP